MKKSLVAALGAVLLAGVASAHFDIDGTKDAAYPASSQFQTVNTNFGDSNSGNIATANGSELDGVFAQFTPGFLNIIFTGNLETNFNKLDIFFDAPGTSTGQNVLNTTGGIGGLNGLTFDTGFAPEYFLRINGGNTPNTFYVNYTTLTNGSTATIDTSEAYLGSNDGQSLGVLSGGTNPAGLRVAVNNSNIAGVGSGTGFSGDPTTVVTGVEFSIPTSMIGDVDFGSGVLISAFINGSGGDYLSNQILGGLPVGTGNLSFDATLPNNYRSPSLINLNSYAGSQYFAVPEPASMAAITLGLGGFLARRRRTSK